MIACWLVRHEALPARDAIARVRRLRPGSVETEEQTEAVVEFARRRKPRTRRMFRRFPKFGNFGSLFC
jgi:atypical dual specificity phosphatase